MHAANATTTCDAEPDDPVAIAAALARRTANVLGDLERGARRMGVQMSPERYLDAAQRIARDELGLQNSQPRRTGGGE